jgi:hypothetical protein
MFTTLIDLMCHEMLHRMVLPNVKVSDQEYQKGENEQEEDQTKKENVKERIISRY